jgi:hypothetical protein
VSQTKVLNAGDIGAHHSETRMIMTTQIALEVVALLTRGVFK